MSEVDGKLVKLQDAIQMKRQFLMNRQTHLNDVQTQNQFLATVRRDYEKYYHFIREQKMEQMNALKLLNTYIHDLNETGELNRQNMENARYEQQRVLDEIASVKNELDTMVD